MPGPDSRLAPASPAGPPTGPRDGFRIAGFVHGPEDASALDRMAGVACLLARLSRAAPRAQSRREA